MCSTDPTPVGPPPGKEVCAAPPDMKKHQTALADPVGHQAHAAPGSVARNTGPHSPAALQREGPVGGRGPLASAESRGTSGVRIHTTLSPAPFLTHSQLTPAQKRFLGSVAGSQSAQRVYSLVNQYYLNVLYSCTRPGLQEEASMLPGTAETTQDPEELQAKAVKRAKHKQPITTAAARHSGKTSLTKLPPQKDETSCKGQVTEHQEKQDKKRYSWSEPLGEEEDFEASLRESLSSLSMEDDEDSVYGDSPR